MKTNKYFFILFIALVLAFIIIQPLYSQGLKGHELADSFMKESARAKSDTDQVKLIIKAAKVLISIDPPVAMGYVDSAMHLSQLHQWKKGIGSAYLNKARVNRTTSDFAAGVENAGKAFELFTSVNWEAARGDALGEIGLNYAALGNYTKAIEYDFKALAIYEELGLSENIAWCYNNIGSDYYWIADYPKAIENYNKALEFFNKTNNKYGIASAIDNIASVYEDQGDLSKVNDYNLQAIKLFEELHDEPAMGRIYINRGNFLKLQKNFDSAVIFYKKAISIAKKLDIKRTLAFGIGGIGEVYLNLAKDGAGRYALPDSLKINRTMLLQKAYGYFSRALETSKKTEGLSLITQFTASLSETEALLGNYKAALSFYKQSVQYKDSIFNDDNKTKIAALEKERLTEVKDKEIQLLNKENALQAATQEKKNTEARRIKNIQYFAIAILGIIVLAVIIIAVIQYRNSKHKQKANILLQQQKEKVESTLSELKSTQAQLVQSEKMASLGELTAGIAHEIQNPLNFVNNFAEINNELINELTNELQSGNNKEAIFIAKDIRENSQKINHHGRRADAIVKGMLQHSRTSTGQKEFTNINALADEYLRLAFHGMRAKDKDFNAVLNTGFDETIGKINIISQDISRVLLNLYNNAFYAVNERLRQAQPDSHYQPTVSVSTKKVGNSITISVSDNGNGIPQNIVEKIFQPFFTTKPTGQGTGLGLSLSYDIVKAHGGEIKVESKEREGTEFIIQLPM